MLRRRINIGPASHDAGPMVIRRHTPAGGPSTWIRPSGRFPGETQRLRKSLLELVMSLTVISDHGAAPLVI